MSYDQDINFETAKVAKLRGFPQRNYSDGYTATGDWCGDFALDVINGRECYAIATQGEVAAWLRKEHQMLISMELLRRSSPNNWEGSIQDMSNGVFMFAETYKDKSYEEVMEELLYTAIYVYLAPNDGNLL